MERSEFITDANTKPCVTRKSDHYQVRVYGKGDARWEYVFVAHPKLNTTVEIAFFAEAVAVHNRS